MSINTITNKRWLLIFVFLSMAALVALPLVYAGSGSSSGGCTPTTDKNIGYSTEAPASLASNLACPNSGSCSGSWQCYDAACVVEATCPVCQEPQYPGASCRGTWPNACSLNCKWLTTSFTQQCTVKCCDNCFPGLSGLTEYWDYSTDTLNNWCWAYSGCDLSCAGELEHSEVCEQSIQCKVSDGCSGSLICSKYVWGGSAYEWKWNANDGIESGKFQDNLCTDGYDNDCDGDCDQQGCCSDGLDNPLINGGTTFNFSFSPNITTKEKCLLRGGSWLPPDYNATRNAGCCPKGLSPDPVTLIENGADCFDGLDNDCDGLFDYEDSTNCTPAVSPTSPKLIFRNSVGPNNVSVIGSNGVMDIRGSVFQSQSSLPITGSDFVLRNGAGSPILVLQRSTGNLYLKGALYQNTAQATLNAYVGGATREFIVRNTASNAVAVMDTSGNMYLLNTLRTSIPNPS
jgi:hypothetical protein